MPGGMYRRHPKLGVTTFLYWSSCLSLCEHNYSYRGRESLTDIEEDENSSLPGYTVCCKLASF